jgi:predicted membrane protein
VELMSSLTIAVRRPWFSGILLLSAALGLAPVRALAADNTFDKTYNVSGHVRLELNNGSGNVDIRGSADNKVHVFGKVTAGWSVFGGSDKNLQDVVGNPPIDQHDNTIHIGRNNSLFKNISIDYKIEVPHDSEIDADVASGGITIDGVRGPVKASSASGYVHVYRVDGDTQLNAASGSIEASGIGGILHVSSASGDITASDVKGDLRVSAASGSIKLTNPGDRVDASSASGSIEVFGAKNDLKIHAISGSVHVEGDPANRFWELKSVSGSVDIRVPSNASFLLSAESMSGGIRTNIPVVLEEQGKHSLRAHIGSSSGRIEVHTVSGGVDVQGS